MKCEDVNLSRTFVCAELHAGNYAYAERICGKLRFLKSAEGIVIGERDCRESRCSGRVHDR
jgi:hypothetical protein